MFLAHGILMTLAWGLLVPLGVLVAQHRRHPSQRDSTKPWWFQVHRAVQTVAGVLVIAAFVLAIIEFDDGSGTLYDSHKVIGILAFCLMMLNILAGLLRPSKEAARRWVFNIGHLAGGLAALTLANVACFLGIKLYSNETGDGVAVWYVVLAIALAIAAAVYLVRAVGHFLRRGRASIHRTGEDEKMEQENGSEH